MAYNVLFLEHLTELKMRVGGTTSPTLATILGINYPTEEAFAVYRWDNSSTATSDDYEIVTPNPRIGMGGRWFRVDLDVTPHGHIIAEILNLQSILDAKIEEEVDPSVPEHVKEITQSNINSWNNPPVQVNADWSSTSGTSEILNKPASFPPSSHTHIQSDITGLSTALDGKISTGSAIPYSTLTGTPTIPTNTNQLINGANFITSGGAPVQSVNGQTGTVTLTIPTTTGQLTNNSGFLTQSGVRSAISLTTTGTSGAATYNSSTGVLNVPNYAGLTRAFTNNATKTINGAGVQLSTTRDAIVSYSVTHTIALTLLLAMGSSQVFLEISSDNSTWTTISQAGYSDGVAVAVALTKTTTSNVQGVVPAGFYVRLRAVTSGAGSATFNSGQEVLI